RERVRRRAEAVRRELVREPARRAERARRAGRSVGVEVGQLARRAQGGGAVEGRRQRGRRQGGGAGDREGCDQERQADEEPRAPVEPPTDGALERAAPRPPANGWGRGRRDTRAIVGGPPTRTLARMSNPATILLVDDEESVQKLLAYPLERDGYRVVQARDGEEALRRFDEVP